jgi:hypothetical protein
MRKPDKIGAVGKAWDGKGTDCYIPALWFVHLPEHHPMLQWFSVAVANDAEDGWQDPEIYVHMLDPESYLFQEPDPDTWRAQKIQFLPDHVLKHQIPKEWWKTSNLLVAQLVDELVSGTIKPDERDAIHNFLVNAENWK